MAAMTSLRLQRLPALDIASGEPSPPCSPRQRKFFDRTSGSDVIVLDGGDHFEIEYPRRVFIDVKISTEEASVHEEVEQTLRTRKLAAIVLQRWWREESGRRRFASCLRRKLLKRALQLWFRYSIFRSQATTVRHLAQKAVIVPQTRSDSIRHIIRAWKGARIRSFCRSIADEGRRLLQRRRAADLISLHLDRYGILQASAIKIQRFWRTRAAIRLKLLLITSLQACLWAVVISSRHDHMTYCIRVLQNCFRRKRLRQTFRNVVLRSYETHMQARNRSAAILQAHWRGHLCRGSLGGSFIKLRARAIVLQKTWRGYRTRREYFKLRVEIRASMTIKKAFLGFVFRKARERHRQLLLRLHAGLSAYTLRSRFLSLKRGSIICQAGLLSVTIFDQHVDNVQSVRVLQCMFRRRRVRQKFRRVVMLAYQEYTTQRSRSAICIQAQWRGVRSRRSIFGSFEKIRSRVLAIQSYLRLCLSWKESLRLRKQSELDSRRQVLFNQLESLPDSRDQRLQSLRERFSQRLANIECVSPGESSESQSALPVKASLLSSLDAKRARLFRVKAHLNTMKGRKGRSSGPKVPAASSVADPENCEKIIKTVRWCDEHGSSLLDPIDHKCSPKTLTIPARPCIKATSSVVVPRKRAQRIINVLSTTFGKAISCRTDPGRENSGRTGSAKPAAMPIPNRVSAKSPLKSSARRVKVITKTSSC